MNPGNVLHLDPSMHTEHKIHIWRQCSQGLSDRIHMDVFTESEEGPPLTWTNIKYQNYWPASSTTRETMRSEKWSLNVIPWEPSQTFIRLSIVKSDVFRQKCASQLNKLSSRYFSENVLNLINIKYCEKRSKNMVKKMHTSGEEYTTPVKLASLSTSSIVCVIIAIFLDYSY